MIDGIKAVLAPQAKAKGITIQWSKVDNINQLIMTKIQANDVPDIALIPQPGVVGRHRQAGQGDRAGRRPGHADAPVEHDPGTLDAGTVDGKLYGLLVSANAKSFVFYPKKAWDAAGYKAPTDHRRAQRADREDQGRRQRRRGAWASGPTRRPGGRRRTGSRTWSCATAAPTATTSGSRTRPSSTPRWCARRPRSSRRSRSPTGNVLGGRKSIASNAFGTAGNPMFDNKPGCILYKQGSFITDLLPEGGPGGPGHQVGVFGFPPATAGGDNPVLGGGDLAMLLKNTAGARGGHEAALPTEHR